MKRNILYGLCVAVFITNFFYAGCERSILDDTNKERKYKLHGINFSPYLKGLDPEQRLPIDESKLSELMSIVAPYSEWIRTYGSVDGLEKAGKVAHQLQLKAAIGAWLSSNLTANEIEIANLISAANEGNVDIAIVGSEVLVRGDLTAFQLVSYIRRVRQAIPSSIPVTTADVCEVLLNNSTVISAVDVVFVNHYPYWQGVKIDCAISALHACHQRLVIAAKNKPVVVSETGWPSCGTTLGSAVPSPENASGYFLNFVSWARANNIPSFYFEAFDERWKTKHEGPQGACWGLWDENGNLKSSMHEVFEDKVITDNWSDSQIPGGEGRPTIEFTYVPKYGTFNNLYGQIWHVRPTEYKVAVYMLVRGGWWTKPYFNSPLTIINCDGSWSCDVTTGGIDQLADEFIAFLIPNGYNPPSVGGGGLPQALFTNAVAITEIYRPR